MRRMLFPIIKKYWKLLLGTAVVAALGCTIIIGLSSGYVSIDSAMSRYLDEYHYPDAYMSTEVTDASRVEDVLAVPGVRAADARIFADTVVVDHSGRYLSVRVFSYDDDDIQRFFFWSTADPQGADEAYLDYNFADVNGIHAGDTLLCRADDEWREVFISALVSMPETLAVQPTNGDWDSNADFGYAYIPHRQVEKASDIFYDKSVARLDEKRQELDDAKKALEDGRKELEEARTALSDAKKTLEDKTKEYNDGKDKLASAEEEISSARSAIASNRSSLEASQAELNSRSATLDSKRAEISKAKAEVDAAQAEIDSGYSQLRSAEAEISSAQAQIDSAQAQLEAQKAEYTNEFGYIPIEVQEVVSAKTGISVAEIFGVVTFYSFFSRWGEEFSLSKHPQVCFKIQPFKNILFDLTIKKSVYVRVNLLVLISWYKLLNFSQTDMTCMDMLCKNPAISDLED